MVMGKVASSVFLGHFYAYVYILYISMVSSKIARKLPLSQKSLSRPVAPFTNSPFTTVFLFSLSLSPPPPLPPLKLVVLSSCRICLRVACGLFFAKWWNVLLFYFSSLTLSAFGEGEIISNYRESRRCRPSSCACSYWLVCGRRMKRVRGNARSSPSLLSCLSITRLLGASERDLSSRIGYLAAFGPI